MGFFSKLKNLLLRKGDGGGNSSDHTIHIDGTRGNQGGPSESCEKPNDAIQRNREKEHSLGANAGNNNNMERKQRTSLNSGGLKTLIPSMSIIFGKGLRGLAWSSHTNTIQRNPIYRSSERLKTRSPCTSNDIYINKTITIQRDQIFGEALKEPTPYTSSHANTMQRNPIYGEGLRKRTPSMSILSSHTNKDTIRGTQIYDEGLKKRTPSMSSHTNKDTIRRNQIYDEGLKKQTPSTSRNTNTIQTNPINRGVLKTSTLTFSDSTNSGGRCWPENRQSTANTSSQNYVKIPVMMSTRQEVARNRDQNIGGKTQSYLFSDTDTPPEDFRTLPVIPKVSDLRPDSEPFLRAALAQGAYRNEDHYLDVQFRLMREDFIQPLRNGINEFRINGCKKNYKSSDIRLYFDVHILRMTTVNGINHELQFDVKPLKSVKWEQSKRFMHGSLLCLSKDNFKTVLFATVAFCNPKKLKSGIISVEFRSGLKTVMCSTPDDTFVMAESVAFFGAYCPILERLQETHLNKCLQKYFVYCQEELQPPKYLLSGSCKYDLSSLKKSGNQTLVPVLRKNSWVHLPNLNVNESQTEAVQLALTKELAIIQGPPGTGKTYVGLKIMKVLIENQKQMAINKKNPNDPILVVCFTNHALDQFLEGVVKFCPEGVVRVGGKSSSQVMEEFNLRHLKSRSNQTFDKIEKKAWWNNKVELKKISSDIQELKKEIDSMQCVVSKSYLAEEIEGLVFDYKQAMKRKRELRMKGDVNILKQAKVIGMKPQELPITGHCYKPLPVESLWWRKQQRF